MNLTEVKKFSYAAYIGAGEDRDGAIAALKSVIAGNFDVVTANGGGLVMTAATATNKSFSYTLPQGLGPKEIGTLAFNAVRFLSALTDTNIESTLLAMPQSSAVGRFA